MRPRFRQAHRGQSVAHIPSKQHRQLEHSIKHRLPSLHPQNGTNTHSELCSRHRYFHRTGALMTQDTAATANIELVRAGVADLNSGDLDACVDRATPDLVMNLAELPEPSRGIAAWRQGAEMMRRAFPDLHAHIEDILAAQDRVAVRLTFTGTHSGEFLGIPATGRSVRYVSHEFYRVTDGLIAEEWICSDMATLIRQIT
ncbi:MAG: ester cyclase [Solirubrobacteraceae bacterium]